MRARIASSALSVVLLVAGVGMAGSGVWIHLKAGLAQILLRHAWAESEGGDSVVRPWPWADTWPVARLEVPSLGVDEIVLAGGSGRTMAFGPGHLDTTVRPGAEGNCVVVGHRDTSFAFLENLEVGDHVFVKRPDGARACYRVRGALVVNERDTWVLRDHGFGELTLITCYPFASPVPGGSLRYVVLADLISAGRLPNQGENR